MASFSAEEENFRKKDNENGEDKKLDPDQNLNLNGLAFSVDQVIGVFPQTFKFKLPNCIEMAMGKVCIQLFKWPIIKVRVIKAKKKSNPIQ